MNKTEKKILTKRKTKCEFVQVLIMDHHHHHWIFFSCLLAVETFEKKRLREKYITFFYSRFSADPNAKPFSFFGKRASLAKLNSFFFCTGLTELYNGGGGQIERIIHLGKSFDPSEKH